MDYTFKIFICCFECIARISSAGINSRATDAADAGSK
jgi:hypothetical protein